MMKRILKRCVDTQYNKCRHQKSVTKTRNLKEEVSIPVSTPNVSSHLLKIFEEKVSTPVSTPNDSGHMKKTFED